jgi:CRP-like cAMP-binding protein
MDHANIDMAELLASVDAFRGLGEAHCQLLSENFKVNSFRGGELIFREGDHIDAFSVIISGSVDIVLPESGPDIQRVSEVKLGNFGPGEHFGEYALLDMRPASASAIAAEDTVLAQTGTRELQLLLDRNSELGKTVFFNLALSLVDRLRQQNMELDLVTFN